MGGPAITILEDICGDPLLLCGASLSDIELYNLPAALPREGMVTITTMPPLAGDGDTLPTPELVRPYRL